jgi:hypothetical protein
LWIQLRDQGEHHLGNRIQGEIQMGTMELMIEMKKTMTLEVEKLFERMV